MLQPKFRKTGHYKFEIVFRRMVFKEKNRKSKSRKNKTRHFEDFAELLSSIKEKI